jgi:hypothetical protein
MKNTQDQEQLRRDMAEAVLLPDNGPTRRQVVRRVQEAGDWAENEWVELVGMDERLRLELPRVAAPSGLHDRLLAIPSTISGAGRSSRRWYAASAVAAGVVLLLIVAGWLSLAEKPDEMRVAQNIATLAATDHLHGPVLTVRSSDPVEVQATLAQATTLPVRLPALGADYQLEGGRICKFTEHPVVYTCWLREGRMHSLYQFRLEDFDLAPGFTDKNLLVTPSATFPTQRVVMWSDGLYGYVLVCEEGGEAPGRETKNTQL